MSKLHKHVTGKIYKNKKIINNSPKHYDYVYEYVDDYVNDFLFETYCNSNVVKYKKYSAICPSCKTIVPLSRVKKPAYHMCPSCKLLITKIKEIP